MKQLFRVLILNIAILSQVHFAYAQSSTASILPPAKTTFFDNNGKPLSKGTVDFYTPGTTDRKMTWQDAGQTIPNTNPVVLDTSGRGLIFGDGSYRQVVKDKNDNIIWDQVTSSTGSGGGGGSTPTVGDGDVVGTIKPYGGFIAPYGYVFAYGQELVRASYPEAFAALTSQQNVSCTIGSPTLTGVGDTSQLPIGAPIESNCLNSGSTISSKTTNTIVASSNAIISTTTSARFFPYGNGDGSLTFNTPDLRGKVIAGRNNMGGIPSALLTAQYFGVSPDASGAVGGKQSHLVVKNELPNYNLSPTFTDATYATDAAHVTSTTNITYGGVSGPITVPTDIGAATVFKNTGVSAIIPLGGGGQEMTIVQPTQTQNYIIKVIPDSNPNSFFGVASIGGMQGVIECGFGITCAGNTISAINSTVPAPSPTTLGGVFTKTCPTSNWFSSVDLTGTFACTQPSFTDINGVASISQGGTGQTSFTVNDPLIGNGASPIAQGTRSGNTTKFATVNGTLSNGNCLSADAFGNISDAGAPCAASSAAPFYVADRTALAALNTANITSAYLVESGRQGIFNFNASDQSANVALDTNQGIYIAPASDPTGASGAWIRSFDNQNYQTSWFGALADYTTDSTAIINSMIAVSNIPNSSPSNGQQRASYINVDGGVKFASQRLLWLPAGNWVFVYINYFANSDTTKGVPTGGGATNELLQISVNSGQPGDPTGALVAEKFFVAPLNPAIGVNVNKNIDSSISKHAYPTTEPQPTSQDAVRANVAAIRDENLDQFRIAYSHYGSNDPNNGIDIFVQNRTTDLTCSGCAGSGGWTGSHPPTVGGVVRGMTTYSRYVVTGFATDIIHTNWLSGTATPGEKLMNEAAIFSGSISGTTLTVTAMKQGSGNIANGATLVGMYTGSGVAASTTIVSQSSGTPGGVGVYTVSASQTVTANTTMVVGWPAINGIAGGGVSNVDTLYSALHISKTGVVTTNSPVLMGTRTSLNNSALSATATLTNAPRAGNPTKWASIDDNGTTRYIPLW